MKAIILSTIFTLTAWAITIGEIPKEISLSGDNGGLVTGETWQSSSIKDKVYMLIYVDPDEKDVNEHFIQALKKKEYDKTLFGTMAIINLGATWKPNFIIEKILNSKQEEFPNTIYAKDKNKLLVDEWGLGDDASNILIFSKDAKLLFYKSGRMEDEDMQDAYRIIENNI